MTIFGIKLVTGEDIIAKIESGDANAKSFGPMMVTLTNPAIIAMMNSPSGPSLGMADYLPFAAKKSIRMEDSKILFMYELDAKLLNAYNAQFGSGLVVAKSLPANDPNVLPFTKK